MIHYKLIEHERVGDAPFVGALISAVDCKFNCPHCFNQNIKNMPTKEDSPQNIIESIKSNMFNKGIIFAGLEWTLQLDETIRLARMAQEQGLKTILYTGCTLEKLAKDVKEVFNYIKCGTYQCENTTANHIEYGIALASTNQHVYKKGVDY